MAALAVSGLSLEWRREENLNLDFFSGFEGADMVSMTSSMVVESLKRSDYCMVGVLGFYDQESRNKNISGCDLDTSTLSRALPRLCTATPILRLIT